MPCIINAQARALKLPAGSRELTFRIHAGPVIADFPGVRVVATMSAESREYSLSDKASTVFQVGDWLVEAELNRISRAGESVQLEPRTIDVLVCLCRSAGAVVSTDELIAEVWSDRPMGDNPVYKAIAKLRRALGDEASKPSYIVTVAKKGYRLIAPVSSPPTAIKSATKSTAGKSDPARIVPVLIGALIGLLLAAVVFWEPESKPRQLEAVSGFRGSHSQPSFSPDGQSIAFVNQDSERPHVAVLELGSVAPRRLTDGKSSDTRPRWSPDGSTIIFVRRGSIWAVPAIGGVAKEIIRNAYNPNWSRDSRSIVFERSYEVWTADADGGRQKRVSGIPRKELPLSPRWPAFSPDGRELVFLDADDTPFADLWRIPVAGGEPIRITSDPKFASAPVWSPNGEYIIYSSQRSGSRTLWQVALDDGIARPLLTGSGDDDYPDISQDGTRLVYSNRRERFSLLRSDLESGEHEILHESRQIVVAPELSPDQKTVAFFAMASDGAPQIFSIPLAGGMPTQLTFNSNATHALPRWSGDGRRIFFYYTEDGSDFRRIESQGGESDVVVSGWDWSTSNGASVSPDESQIMYSRLIGQVPVQTNIRSLDTGSDRAFYATLEYPRWSGDGRKVVGARHIDQRFPGDVSICPIAGDECQLIAEGARIPMWSPDETEVYYVRGFGTAQELFVAPSTGAGNERKLLTMAPLFPLGPFYDVTADGDILWVRHEQELSELWTTALPD